MHKPTKPPSLLKYRTFSSLEISLIPLPNFMPPFLILNYRSVLPDLELIQLYSIYFYTDEFLSSLDEQNIGHLLRLIYVLVIWVFFLDELYSIGEIP